MRKLYLSMPITGYDITERISFSEMMQEKLAQQYNCEVVTPFTVAPYDPKRSYGDCMKLCIKELMNCDIVFFCSGWQISKGCNVEKIIVDSCNIPCIVTWDGGDSNNSNNSSREE